MDLTVITITWNNAAYIADQIRSVVLAVKALNKEANSLFKPSPEDKGEREGVEPDGDSTSPGPSLSKEGSSVIDNNGLTYEHLIVDNASTDATVATIEHEFPHLRLIKNTANRGFAAANNQAAKEARGEFILFLNPDMRFREAGALRRWVEWMRLHPAVGIAVCKLVNESGEINLHTTPRRFPRLFDQLIIILKLHHFFPSLLDNYLMRGTDWGRERSVDAVQGSCMLVRRELIDKLGRAFDERFFIWFEDVDLCREAKRLGYEVFYTPIVSCVDYGGQSFKKRSLAWKQWQFIVSLVKYFCKWGLKV